MRRLKYFFTVAEGEKVTEKCFRRILLSSALGILLCMTCLISSTWALFTTTLVSEGNSIEVGTFTAIVTVGDTNAVEISAETASNYSLAETGTYKFTITNKGTAKGYCRVDILKAMEENPETFFTTGTLFANPESELGMTYTFSIVVTEANLYSISITPHWGADPDTGDEVENLVYTTGTGQLSQGQEGTEVLKFPPPTETQPPSEPVNEDETTQPDATEEPSDPTQETTEPDATEEPSDPTQETTQPQTEETVADETDQQEA